MRVENMKSKRTGREVPNQFIIIRDNENNTKYFQSYSSIIVKCEIVNGEGKITLDINKWDYSRTTAKYRNRFLGETTKETEKNIKNGKYVLADLNK